jgi:hypothetical protein
MPFCRDGRSRALGSRRKRRTKKALLASQATQSPLQLGGPSGGVVCEATRPRARPQSSVLTACFLYALTVARVYPFPLRLPESFLELRASRLLGLRQQILICPVQISIVQNDRAIQAGALVDWRGRVARVSGRCRLPRSGSV